MRLYDRVTPRRVYIMTERLKRLPCWGHPALRVRFNAEATEGYVFGCRAGPGVGFKNVAHELAHAVQFRVRNFKQRMGSYGSFVFKVHQVRFMGKAYDEPNTDQVTMRELETFAIQRHLMEMAGCKVNPEAWAKYACDVVAILPDWYKFKRETREKVLSRRLAKFYAKWTKEAITKELTAWLDAMQERTARGVASKRVGDADIFFSGTATAGAQALPRARRPSTAMPPVKAAVRPVMIAATRTDPLEALAA